MIKKATTLWASGTNPHENIALEHYLLQNVEADEIILYLWQNKKTVVIGKNQNCYAECNVEKLKSDGGFLARRLSGGGAVFHDTGNLNFTFIAHAKNYDVARQTDVILSAVRAFGINAQRTGRNDIEVDGRKFSGNAFYAAGARHMHHGTLLIKTDVAMMTQYLTVNNDKLQGHGVKSVKSRVVNLSDLNPDITPQTMSKALFSAFESEYGIKSTQVDAHSFNNKEIDSLYKKYSGDDWCINSQREFTCTLKERFAWGGVELCLDVHAGKIKNAVLYTDALNGDISFIVAGCLQGTPFNKHAISQRILSAESTESVNSKNSATGTMQTFGTTAEIVPGQELSSVLSNLAQLVQNQL